MSKLRILASASIFCLTMTAQQSGGDLFEAVRNNDLGTLKASLAKGANVNSVDDKGNTPLIVAAEVGSAAALKLLLDSGADVNAKNGLGVTALLRAANDPRKAKMLVDKGAGVNAVSKMGRTPLIVAATCDGCAETVRLLIAKGADVKAADQRGETALYSAAEANDLDTMRLLIGNGAGVGPDSGGHSPLMSASAYCNLPAINLLLEKGAAINASTTFAGEVKFGKIQLIGLTPLMQAAPYCSPEVVDKLLKAGAGVNDKDIRGMTPLMLAVASETQDVEVVKLLLKAGADVNVRSTAGETPLDWANKFGNKQVIETLTAAGGHAGDPYVTPKIKKATQRTPLQAEESGMKLLQASTTEFFRQSGCSGCHNQPITTRAFAAVRASGVHADESAARSHIQMLNLTARNEMEMLLERIEPGGFIDPPIHDLFALAAANAERNPAIEATLMYLAGAQSRDGAWRNGGISRAPISEGSIQRTAMALRSLQAYCPPGQKSECAERIDRARDWLARAKAETNDDFAMQVLGLHWAAGDSRKQAAATSALTAAQRQDGGWAQNRNLTSDAYATGEALWALKESGALKISDPAYQRGVKFLLGTQAEDGSWYVRSRAPKLQPYFQGGFPYNHDQWISSTATGFAVMALAPAASPTAH